MIVDDLVAVTEEEELATHRLQGDEALARLGASHSNQIDGKG